MHRYQKSGEHDYVDNFFEINEWEGEPVNNESSKCSELVWANPDDLELEIVPYLKEVFRSIESSEKYLEILRGDQE